MFQGRPEGYILLYCHIGEQCIPLEYGIYVSRIRGYVVYVCTEIENIAACRRFKTADYPERRGLSTARRPQQREELISVYVQVDIVQHRSLCVLVIKLFINVL